MATKIEIERKYDVHDDTVLPRFDGVGEGMKVVDAGTSDLFADYFDTSGFALASHRVVLRRRRGGSDEGWHVKRVASRDTNDRVRLETHWPLTGGSVPPEALETVRVFVRDHPLVPVATIHTVRTLLHVIAGDGTAVAEIADDRVCATDASTGVVRTWREWEVELLDGAPADEQDATALLDLLESHALRAGAVPASSSSKLATALGRTSVSDASREAPVTASSPASELLRRVLGRWVEELCGFDPVVRANEPDAVHQMRTRVRRIRSVLASYQDVFDRPDLDAIRFELAHLGKVLGRARDQEVMRDRANSILDSNPLRALVDAREAQALREELTTGWVDAYTSAHSAVTTELDSIRYFRLLDRLEELVAQPPLGRSSGEAAGRVAERALRRDTKRVVTAAKRATAAGSATDRVEMLHDVRKAAKRLRYSAEAATGRDFDLAGRSVRLIAAAAQSLHDLLGEHRDSSLMQQHLRTAAPHSTHPFAYGVMFERERLAASHSLAEYPAAVQALKRLR